MAFGANYLALAMTALAVAGCSQSGSRVPVCPLADDLPRPVGNFETYAVLEGVGETPVPDGWSIRQNLPSDKRLKLSSLSGIELQPDFECCSVPDYLRDASQSGSASGRPMWVESDQRSRETVRGFLFPFAYVNPADLEKRNIVFAHLLDWNLALYAEKLITRHAKAWLLR